MSIQATTDTGDWALYADGTVTHTHTIGPDGKAHRSADRSLTCESCLWRLTNRQSRDAAHLIAFYIGIRKKQRMLEYEMEEGDSLEAQIAERELLNTQEYIELHGMES